MIISKRAIKAFRKRKRRNSSKAKRFTPQAIKRKIEALDPPMQFITKPYHHQRLCFLLGVNHPRYYFNLDMGTGKSKLALDLFWWHREAGNVERLLILVPFTVNITTWLDEIAIHAPDLVAVGLDESADKERREWALFESIADVVILTGASMLRLLCDSRGKGKGLAPSDARIRRASKRFGMLVADELSELVGSDNSNNLYFRVLRKLTHPKHTFSFYALSGTPWGKTPVACWPQFYLVDRGESFGETLGLFRSVFCSEREDYFAGTVYEFDKRKMNLFRQCLRHNSIRIDESECFDMPSLNMPERIINFDDATWRYYEKARQEFVSSGRDRELSASAFHNMRNLVAGFFVGVEENGERCTVELPTKPKLDALLAWLHEVPPDEKVVVFNDYRKTGELICNALTAAKINHVRIYGGTNKKGEVLRTFKEDPDVRVLVGQNKSCAYNLNMQFARYAAVFEAPCDPKIMKQLLKRLHRGGQKRSVFIYHFIVNNSVDVRIYDSLAQGRNLFEDALSGSAKL